MSQENRISFPQLHMRPLITVATSKVNVNLKKIYIVPSSKVSQA